MFKNVIDKKLVFNGALTKFTKAPTMIVLHHSGASADQTVEQIHNYHIGKGWLGVGYNFLVDKNGVIYNGRGIEYVGAQCKGYNNKSIGICAIGNMDVDQMPEAQKVSIIRLVKDIKAHYTTITKIVGHKELSATSCPGDKYPLEEIKDAKEQAASSPTPAPTDQAYDFKSLQKYIGSEQDNIPGPETLGKCPLKKKGAIGNVVRWIQTRLNFLGYNCGKVDSIFGTKTQTTVINFQTQNGLSADGVVGPKTWAKLLGL